VIERIAGLALAGGASRRLGGGDKPLLRIGGRSMLERVLEVLAAEAGAVAISANGDRGRFAAFGRPVLPDGEFAGSGPLAGVLAGLNWAAGLGAEALLTVPGDTPFVPAGLAAALAPEPACAESNGVPHYLVALWPVAVRSALRSLLSAGGQRAVGRFAAEIGMRRVVIPALPRDPFLNVNTPEELAAARAVVEDTA
jgi:molybdopterin-guanine dinucleotide biosynthesis protein A